MDQWKRAVLVVLILHQWHVFLVTGLGWSCLDSGSWEPESSSASSSSSSSHFPAQCCQCTEEPVVFHCRRSCPQNMCSVKTQLTVCAALPEVTVARGRLVSLSLESLSIRKRGRDGTDPLLNSESTQSVTKRDPPTIQNTPLSKKNGNNDTTDNSPNDDDDDDDDDEKGRVDVFGNPIVGCRPCHKACKGGCTGPGPEHCLGCAEGYGLRWTDANRTECVPVVLPDSSGPEPPPPVDHSTRQMAVVSLALVIILMVMLLLTAVSFTVHRSRRWMRKKWTPYTERSFGNSDALAKLGCIRSRSTCDPEYSFPDYLEHMCSVPRMEEDRGTLYDEIESSLPAPLEVYMEKVPLMEDSRQGSSAVQPVEKDPEQIPPAEDSGQLDTTYSEEEETHTFPTITSKVLGVGTPLWAEDLSTVRAPHICSGGYCDYRLPSIAPTRDHETDLKMPTQERAAPLSMRTAGLQKTRYVRAFAPPLPPRNKTHDPTEGMEAETCMVTMSSVGYPSSSLSDAGYTAEKPLPKPAEQGGFLGDSDTKEDTLSTHWPTPSIEQPAMTENSNPSDTAEHEAGKETESNNSSNNNTGLRHETENHQSAATYIDISAGLKTTSQHFDSDSAPLNPVTDGGTTELDNDTGPDITAHSPSSADFLLSGSSGGYIAIPAADGACPPSPAAPFPKSLTGRGNGKIPIYSCAPREPEENSWYGIQKVKTTLSSLSSVTTSLEMSSTYMLSVSSASPSDGQAQPCQQRPLKDSWEPPKDPGSKRRISWKFGDLCNKHVEETKIYNPYSAFPTTTSPREKLPALPCGLLPEKSIIGHNLREQANILSTYLLTGSKQSGVSDSKGDCGPAFSSAWQKEQVIDPQGGFVRTDWSDGYLEIPLGAVPTGQSVTIKASISTSLEQAYNRLGLPEEENICSPIAEYFAGVGFTFLSPVRIFLAHFLPRKHSSEQVSVYVFQHGATGKLSIKRLKPRSKDSQDGEETDVFSVVDDKFLVIYTHHFSGYFCTVCQKTRVPQDLNLVLFARNKRKTGDECEVDVLLQIWDNRLELKDFREVCFRQDSAVNMQNMQFIDRKTLSPPEDDVDLKDVSVACELTDEDTSLWTHAKRRDGTLKYPVPSPIPLKYLCSCRSFPKRVDWKLTKVPAGTTTDLPDLFSCLVDVGYVFAGQFQQNRPLCFLDNPPKVTIDVSVDPCLDHVDNGRPVWTPGTSEHSSSAGQSGRNCLEGGQPPTNTQLKSLDMAPSSSGPVASAQREAHLHGHSQLSLQNLQRLLIESVAMAELDRSTPGYSSFSELQARGVLSWERAGPRSQSTSLSQPGSQSSDVQDNSFPSWPPPNITFIQNAAKVSLSLDGSSAGNSSALSSMQCSSVNSSASSENAPAAARPRRPDNLFMPPDDMVMNSPVAVSTSTPRSSGYSSSGSGSSPPVFEGASPSSGGSEAHSGYPDPRPPPVFEEASPSSGGSEVHYGYPESSPPPVLEGASPSSSGSEAHNGYLESRPPPVVVGVNPSVESDQADRVFSISTPCQDPDQSAGPC